MDRVTVMNANIAHVLLLNRLLAIVLPIGTLVTNWVWGQRLGELRQIVKSCSLELKSHSLQLLNYCRFVQNADQCSMNQPPKVPLETLAEFAERMKHRNFNSEDLRLVLNFKKYQSGERWILRGLHFAQQLSRIANGVSKSSTTYGRFCKRMCRRAGWTVLKIGKFQNLRQSGRSWSAVCCCAEIWISSCKVQCSEI